MGAMNSSLHPARPRGGRKIGSFGELLGQLPQLKGDLHLRHGATASAVLHDNRLRAAWATEALLAYAKHTFAGSAKSEDVDTILSGLLADLMHLCDLCALDFGLQEARARGHYQAELGGGLEAGMPR
jgi:hypothetical protein